MHHIDEISLHLLQDSVLTNVINTELNRSILCRKPPAQSSLPRVLDRPFKRTNYLFARMEMVAEVRVKFLKARVRSYPVCYIRHFMHGHFVVRSTLLVGSVT